MKKYLKPLLNWRIDVLTVLAMLAIVLIMGDTENIIVFCSIKAAAFTLGYSCYRLALRWDKQGLIDELNVFTENR